MAVLSEPNEEDAVGAAIDSAITLTTVVFAYTLTFGLAGVCILWWLSQRSLVIWASAGLVMGALGGFLLAELAMDRAGRPLVVFSGITSVALFLLIRAIAGVQDSEATG